MQVLVALQFGGKLFDRVLHAARREDLVGDEDNVVRAAPRQQRGQEPLRGVLETARVVKAGGLIAAYALLTPTVRASG